MPLSDVQTDPHPRSQRRITRARQRGLARLGILVVVVGWLVVLAANGLFSGGSNAHPASTATSRTHTRIAIPRATTSSLRLTQPLHGATAAAGGDRLLVVGGADRADVSNDGVLSLDSRTGKVSSGGTLEQPLHDAAAATVGGHTLVFGGGAATTFGAAQV